MIFPLACISLLLVILVPLPTAILDKSKEAVAGLQCNGAKLGA